MAYDKDYYRILGLASPSASVSLSADDIRKAYKTALLGVHPDKKKDLDHLLARNQGDYTVDQVKEAYAVLTDARTKKEYDAWYVSWARTVAGTTWAKQGRGAAEQGQDQDFILGLEVLDLDDFDELDEEEGMAAVAPAPGQMEWVRSCRCGAARGFRIREEELERAEARGEKEVLVGCEGCSLWVRVGFDVQEEEEEEKEEANEG